MAKIKMLRSAGAALSVGKMLEGTTHDVEESIAKLLCDGKRVLAVRVQEVAERVAAKAEEIAAPAKEPELKAVAKPTAKINEK